MARSATMAVFVMTVGEVGRHDPALMGRLCPEGVPLRLSDTVTVRVLDGFPIDWFPGPDPLGRATGYRDLDPPPGWALVHSGAVTFPVTGTPHHEAGPVNAALEESSCL